MYFISCYAKMHTPSLKLSDTRSSSTHTAHTIHTCATHAIPLSHLSDKTVLRVLVMIIFLLYIPFTVVFLRPFTTKPFDISTNRFVWCCVVKHFRANFSIVDWTVGGELLLRSHIFTNFRFYYPHFTCLSPKSCSHVII